MKLEAETAIQRARMTLGSLDDQARRDAEELIVLCEAHFDPRGRAPENLKRDAARLVEVLARRSAHAMPYAALGRALLADASGSPKMAAELFAEFEAKLSMLGL